MKKFVKLIIMCIIMVICIINNISMIIKLNTKIKNIEENKEKISSEYDELRHVINEYNYEKYDLNKKLNEGKEYLRKIELDNKVKSLDNEIANIKEELVSKKEERNEAIKNSRTAEEEAEKRVQANKEKKIYNAVQTYVNEYESKNKTIKITEIKYIEKIYISGANYYVYELTYKMDDDYYWTGDSRVIVNSDTFEVAIMYSNGQIVSKDEILNPYENISASEINKNQFKYWGKRVSLVGRITYIKETISGGDLVITDNNGERISVRYLGSLDGIINNDYISVKGTVTSDTAEYYNAFNAKIVLPIVTSEKKNIRKIGY